MVLTVLHVLFSARTALGYLPGTLLLPDYYFCWVPLVRATAPAPATTCLRWRGFCHLYHNTCVHTTACLFCALHAFACALPAAAAHTPAACRFRLRTAGWFRLPATTLPPAAVLSSPPYLRSAARVLLRAPPAPCVRYLFLTTHTPYHSVLSAALRLFTCRACPAHLLTTLRFPYFAHSPTPPAARACVPGLHNNTFCLRTPRFLPLYRHLLLPAHFCTVPAGVPGVPRCT